MDNTDYRQFEFEEPPKPLATKDTPCLRIAAFARSNPGKWFKIGELPLKEAYRLCANLRNHLNMKSSTRKTNNGKAGVWAICEQAAKEGEV